MHRSARGRARAQRTRKGRRVSHNGRDAKFEIAVEAIEKAVQSVRDDVATRRDLAVLEARVADLERRLPPAA